VTNAAKHADGNPPTIALNYTDVGVELRVGNALPDATAVEHPDSAGGYGLAGMHERLRLIDGELHAGSVGDRWVVQARVTRSRPAIRRTQGDRRTKTDSYYVRRSRSSYRPPRRRRHA
jgi:glucose-6-phosphate-specific signal transduction histidine kinase